MNHPIDIILAFIVYLTDTLALSVSSVLLIHHVLHWKFRDIQKTLVIISALSLLCATSMTVTYYWTKQHGGDLNAFITEMILPLFYLIGWIILTLRIEGRGAKKVVVTWVAIGIVTAIHTRFAYVPHMLSGYISNPLFKMLISLLSNALVLLFAWFLTRISKKQSPRPIRAGTVALLGLLLFVFDEIVLSEIELIASAPLSISINVYANQPFYSALDILLYFVAIIIAFFIFAQKSENTYYKELIDANENYLNAQAQYYEAIDQSNTDIRKIRHDMRNNLTVLALLLENQDYPKMKTYLEEINASVQSADIGIRNGNSIADVIIFDKIKRASEAGCQLTVEGPFTYSGLSATDTCAIIGNILDNAIESASRMPSDKRDIKLEFSKTDHFFVITENNYSHKLTIADNNIIATSKKDKSNHGFGLLSIKAAVTRYNGEVQITCEPTGDALCIFRIEIVLAHRD